MRARGAPAGADTLGRGDSVIAGWLVSITPPAGGQSPRHGGGLPGDTIAELRAMWWRMVRSGAALPPEAGAILIAGGGQ